MPDTPSVSTEGSERSHSSGEYTRANVEATKGGRSRASPELQGVVSPELIDLRFTSFPREEEKVHASPCVVECS